MDSDSDIDSWDEWNIDPAFVQIEYAAPNITFPTEMLYNVTEDNIDIILNTLFRIELNNKGYVENDETFVIYLNLLKQKIVSTPSDILNLINKIKSML